MPSARQPRTRGFVSYRARASTRWWAHTTSAASASASGNGAQLSSFRSQPGPPTPSRPLRRSRS